MTELKDPRCIALTVAQDEELRSYQQQIQMLVAARGRFIQYLVREHKSAEKGPFELIDGFLVPQDLLPKPVKL